MRIRLTVVTAVLTACSLLLGTGPASAATITRSDVVASLLTARNLPDGWHKADLSGGGSEVTGCASAQSTPTGVKARASRDFRYAKTAAFVNESVVSFGTRRAARRDFTQSVRRLSSCTEVTVDGRTFTVQRLTVSGYADQVAVYRLLGSVATAAGDVPVSIVVAVTRWGRQQVSAMTTIGGTATSADLRALKRFTVSVSKAGTGKVATVLGR